MGAFEERKIYLEKTEERKDGIIRYPLYQDCYVDAMEAMWNNIQHNKETDILQNPQELRSNLIAFIGVRGSGKTTALCEYNHILKRYDDYEGILLSEEGTSRREGWFHVLRSIDASLLEKDEDIIELIWANMYQDFDNTNERGRGSAYKDYLGEDAKKIIAHFDEVYRNYRQSRENTVLLGDTALAKLRNRASSLKTRQVCGELIVDFLNYMQNREGGKKKDAFMVVTVDDLDLNLESGYRILENLYRYLNNPQVIVLVAIDFKQMKTLSDNHFKDTLSKGKSLSGSYNFDHAERLSNDFLLKVLPLSNRIFMPDNKNILKNVEVVDSSRRGNLKQFILSKIAEKMEIFYDAKGLKRHFCVPQTLRELVQYNDFLETLHDVEKEGTDADSKMHLYDANHERFNRDISENMALRILNLEQLDIFALILDRNIERRAEYAVNFLNSRRKDVSQSKSPQKISDSVDDNSYCYSDLLEAIYELGRECYKDKALVHCVLASFTSEMTREYYSYVNNPNIESSQRAAGRLRNFLGNTVSGEWFKTLGPVVSMPEFIGGDAFLFPCASRVQINSFSYYSRVSIEKVDIVCIAQRITYLVPILECLFMLFVNFYDDKERKVSPMWGLDIRVGETENGTQCEVTIDSSSSMADFDIFGFIGKEMERSDTLNGKIPKCNTHKEIVELFYRELCRNAKIRGESITGKKRKKCKDILNEASIWEGREEKKIYFPFYNLDLSYNVLKRVRRKIVHEKAVHYDELLYYLQRVYGYIAEELYGEDEYYAEIEKNINNGHKDGQRKTIVPNFVDDFISHPYIQAIGCQYQNDNLTQAGVIEPTINANDFLDFLSTILQNAGFFKKIEAVKREADVVD